MHFDFFVSDDSVATYDAHRKTIFFRAAFGDLLSLAQFPILCNENLGKYCLNVALLYGNWLNELTLSVSPKKFLKNMPLFTEFPPPPPPLPPNEGFKFLWLGLQISHSSWFACFPHLLHNILIPTLHSFS